MKRKITTLLLMLALVIASVSPTHKAEAASLYTYDTIIEVGGTAKIELLSYYGKKTAKWSLSNSKATITKKAKKYCKIKGKSAGTVYLKCKIGKKTYKKKITVKAKSKVTFENYQKIEKGMTLQQVINILGNYTDVKWSESNTDEEYNRYLEYQKEYGGWEDYLYHEQICYHWHNDITNKDITVTFNDDSMIEKYFY